MSRIYVGCHVPEHVHGALVAGAVTSGRDFGEHLSLLLGSAAEGSDTSRQATAEDVRLMIREEIRAALREEHDDNPLLHATHCHTGAPRRAG